MCHITLITSETSLSQRIQKKNQGRETIRDLNKFTENIGPG